MNELFFFNQIILLSTFSLIALKLGKESLTSFMSVCWILANLFVLKQIKIFGLDSTATDAFSVGATLSLNLIQEYYGRSAAKKAIWTSFFCSFLYLLASIIHLNYIPSKLDISQPFFHMILINTPRIVVASFVTYLLVQSIDYKIYGFLKRKFKNRHIVARNFISLGVTQLLDTVLFTFLGLYGILKGIGSIILVSYGIKLIVIFSTGPFISASKKLLKDK